MYSPKWGFNGTLFLNGRFPSLFPEQSVRDATASSLFAWQIMFFLSLGCQLLSFAACGWFAHQTQASAHHILARRLFDSQTPSAVPGWRSEMLPLFSSRWPKFW